MSDRPDEDTDLARRARIALEDRSIDWPALENLIHIDPAGRGLASFVPAASRSNERLDAGQLRAAANDLATSATEVAVVTGFCVVTPHRIAAETDGPPGALFLARVLLECGIDVHLISDARGVPLLAAGSQLFELDPSRVVEFPSDAEDSWLEMFFHRGSGSRLTHLVAIERPGPSHTLESIERQPSSVAARERFLHSVPMCDRGVCHNMRGESVERWTARTDRLFEWIAARHLAVKTIGIGDGGNEIGMGRFAWQSIVEAIASEAAPRIACRIATDFSIIGGVSDWAAYALALAAARLRGVNDDRGTWTADAQSELIKRLVDQAGAVDGITRRADPTVDGLPLDVYLAPLVAMRKLLGFEG